MNHNPFNGSSFREPPSHQRGLMTHLAALTKKQQSWGPATLQMTPKTPTTTTDYDAVLDCAFGLLAMQSGSRFPKPVPVSPPPLEEQQLSSTMSYKSPPVNPNRTQSRARSRMRLPTNKNSQTLLSTSKKPASPTTVKVDPSVIAKASKLTLHAKKRLLKNRGLQTSSPTNAQTKSSLLPIPAEHSANSWTTSTVASGSPTLTQKDKALTAKRSCQQQEESGEVVVAERINMNWMGRFRQAEAFLQENGHCYIPHAYPPNQALSRWSKRQRYQYKLFTQGKTSSMTRSRIDALESLGFCWDAHSIQWRERYEELKAFIKEHGHPQVPTTYENQQLATWVKCQRRQMRIRLRGVKEMDQKFKDRQRLLEAVGFVW